MAEDTLIAPMTIRNAALPDLPAILALFAADDVGGHKEASTLAPMADYEHAFAVINASEVNHLFVAELSGAVVGTYQLTFIPGLVDHCRVRAKVENVHVLPDQRGNGIGAAMMRHALETAKAKGAGHVELTSNKLRTAAHRFYERLGFVRSHEGFKLVF